MRMSAKTVVPAAAAAKEFDNICTTTFRFDNPDAADLLFMKKLLSAGKREILQEN